MNPKFFDEINIRLWKMVKVLLQGLMIVLVWISLWSLIEMSIDDLVGDNRRRRAFVYFALLVFAMYMIVIIEITLDEEG